MEKNRIVMDAIKGRHSTIRKGLRKLEPPERLSLVLKDVGKHSSKYKGKKLDFNQHEFYWFIELFKKDPHGCARVVRGDIRRIASSLNSTRVRLWGKTIFLGGVRGFAKGIGDKIGEFAAGLGEKISIFTEGVGSKIRGLAVGTGDNSYLFGVGVGKNAEKFAESLGGNAKDFALGLGTNAGWFAEGLGKNCPLFARGLGKHRKEFVDVLKKLDIPKKEKKKIIKALTTPPKTGMFSRFKNWFR